MFAFKDSLWAQNRMLMKCGPANVEVLHDPITLGGSTTGRPQTRTSLYRESVTYVVYMVEYTYSTIRAARFAKEFLRRTIDVSRLEISLERMT
jgi:hypothetical protein